MDASSFLLNMILSIQCTCMYIIYWFVLKNLQPCEAVLVVDYKMKVEGKTSVSGMVNEDCLNMALM